MKKWNVIFWVFFGLLIIMWIFDFFVKSESIYWLVGELSILVVLLIGLFVRWNNDKDNPKILIVLGMCWWTFYTGYIGYKEIARYKSDKCDDRFGREFNLRRRRLGTPEIPADWHVDYKGRGHVTWNAKDTVGHAIKYIDIDSSCTIWSEEDFYNLKPIHNVSRDVSISTRYAKGKDTDSISYHYEAGFNTGRAITRQQADSIFATEKIKKDY